MHDALTRYQRADDPLPAEMEAWTLTGAGWESLGLDDRPVRMRLPALRSEELLMRVDACSLCFS